VLTARDRVDRRADTGGKLAEFERDRPVEPVTTRSDQHRGPPAPRDVYALALLRAERFENRRGQRERWLDRRDFDPVRVRGAASPKVVTDGQHMPTRLRDAKAGAAVVDGAVVVVLDERPAGPLDSDHRVDRRADPCREDLDLEQLSGRRLKRVAVDLAGLG